jgi:hypothetical protein
VPNALARESSPYLRQHAENPVDWMPWGREALERARVEDRPLLVSIGYSACHWCHVMERESFEDPVTAALMNECFVCVKVDREERPDVDALYMEAVQSMTGQGGWPLNVFLTPEQIPFYGGTYFPPSPRPGMPAWSEVLRGVADAWQQSAAEIRAGGDRVRERLGGAAGLRPSATPLSEGSLQEAQRALSEAYDARHGGFGGAPKFPHASAIEFLLLRGERAMSMGSLHAMAAGGIHDQLGGGFARYSVDRTWTVPHFEKMLYDNALLARAYLHGWKLSGEERLREVCIGTLEWVLREMRGPEGGFYSALDADSEGVEGRYYLWGISELRAVLGEDAERAIAWLGASEQGNFRDPHHPQPGQNVLSDRGPDPGTEEERRARRRIRSRLLAAREQRERPALDDKRLTGWNALMIAALADAGAELGEPRYLAAAERCADFLLADVRDAGGGLLRTYSREQAGITGYLEDHAFMLEALIALFEASCSELRLEQARDLASQIIDRFADPLHGGFFSTASDGEALIARRKDIEDAPIPSGYSSAASGLLRLSQLTGESEYERQAVSAMRLVADIAPRHPTAFGHMLAAMHWQLAPARPVACALPAAAESRAARTFT